MNMTYSPEGQAVTKFSEGFSLKPYPDTGHVWTDGWGNTHGVVPFGPPISMAKANIDFGRNTLAAIASVNKNVKVKLTQGQFDALVDFDFNIGDDQFLASTLLRKLNAGDYAGAAAEFKRWNKDNGKVQPGLVIRRKKNECMFNGVPYVAA